MQDRPTLQELLAAVRAFLEDDAVPALDGRRRFHARVAANVLAIVGREVADDATLTAEWTRLATLLGHAETTSPVDPAARHTAVRELTVALVERIRRGDADTGPFASAVRAHVRATVREKLRVANPEYLARSG